MKKFEKIKKEIQKKVFIPSLIKALSIPLLIFPLFILSCQLFENDVAEFMEKYTETAAIETHEFNVNTYEDDLSQLCIASYEETEISLLIRNPKKFTLIPSVSFPELPQNFDRSQVVIEQKDISLIKLSLPQQFLISADEGHDISAVINLNEPMSGRDFEKYTINLHCNSKPPLILNPTVLNNNNQTFVIAFDMPNEEETAIRHKDLCEIVINGISYPLSVTTKDSTEIEGIKVAEYDFSDSHFSRSWNNNFRELNERTFTHNKNSVYFETEEAFTSLEDKEYTIILKDRAGLSSTVKASTSITKLVKPLIKDQEGNEIPEDGLINIPFDEESKKGKITIIPPEKDQRGNDITGTVTLHYNVYEATGNGLIYTGGTSTQAIEIELPQNTYRVEAYATCMNYENSATTTVRFRMLNNALYVEANFQNGDGSEAAPFATIAEALADINARNRKETRFTIYLSGDFTAYTADKDGNMALWGNLTLENTINTSELIIEKNPKSPKLAENTSAKLSSVSLKASVDSDLKVTIGDITITNPDGTVNDGNGISLLAPVELTIDGTTITGCFSNAIYAEAGTLKLKAGNINQNSDAGISIENSSFIMEGGTISENSSCGIIVNNASTLNLYGGTISANKDSGICISDNGTLNIKNNPVVTNNTKGSTAHLTSNLVLPKDKLINITGPLTQGASIGVTIHADNKPSAIGDKYSFTKDYESFNSTAPSDFFTSDQGYGIIKSGTEVSLVNTGSSGGQQLATDYNITFTATEMDGSTPVAGMYYGSSKSIILIPQVFFKSNPIDIQIVGNDLMIEGTKVIISAAIYNGGSKAFDIPAANLTGQIDGKLILSIPQISYQGNYTLKIRTTFLSLTYDTSIELTVDYSAENSANYISSLTTPGNYNIIVEGPVGAGTDDGLAKVANAIKRKTGTGITISLDASGTKNAVSLSQYTSGYFKDCSALYSFVMPDWMKAIIPSLFENCTGLTRIDIPNSITDIYTNALTGCTALTTINYEGTSSQWKAIDRKPGWHENVPATVVHCTDGDCELDETI